jgi:hypothetical protein
MITRKTKFFSAAGAAVALIATVAVAHTVHTHTVPTDEAHISTGKVIATPPAQTTPAPPHGAIVCGMALDSDCEKLETLLPM